MEMSEGKKKIGMVGGGSEGRSLLEIFAKNAEIDVVFIAEASSDAPAMALAAKMGVKAVSNLQMALKNFPVDLLIDAGASPENAEILQQQEPGKIIHASAAIILLKMVEKLRGQNNNKAFSDLSSVRQEIDRNTRDASKALHGIEKISNELEVLAINAGIQASRAGEFGKGFSVVAGEVKSTARVARDLAGEIDRIIVEINSSSDKLGQSLKRIL